MLRRVTLDIPEDTILHSHRRENLKSYTLHWIIMNYFNFMSYNLPSNNRDNFTENNSKYSFARLSWCTKFWET
jgi:hypothetical protein